MERRNLISTFMLPQLLDFSHGGDEQESERSLAIEEVEGQAFTSRLS